MSVARVSARTRTRSSGSKCAAISTNVTSAVAPATYFCSAMLTRTRPAPFGFIEPCLGGSMLENREAEVGSRRLASRAERGRRITSGSEAAIAQKRMRPVLRREAPAQLHHKLMRCDHSGIAPRHQPIALVLDLVNPVRPGRWLLTWQAGFNEGGRGRQHHFATNWRPKRIGQAVRNSPRGTWRHGCCARR